jgi:signal transduction histidine kinase
MPQSTSDTYFDQDSRTQVNEIQSVAPFFDVPKLIEEARLREQQNDLVTATEFVNKAWQVFKESDETRQIEAIEADLLQVSAQIHLRQQDFAKLEEYIRPLLEVSRRLRDKTREAWALLNLGIIRSIESDYHAAITLFLESLERSEQTGFRSNVANCLINIGNVYANMFNYEDAFDRYRIALNEYADVLNDTTRIAVNLNIGNLWHAAEQYDLALEYFEKGMSLAVTDKSQQDILAHAHALMSRSLLALEKLDLAIHHAQLSDDFQTDKYGAGRQINLLNMAQIAFRQEDTEGGANLAIRGIAAARKVHDDVSELRGFALLAQIFGAIKNYKRAYRAQEIYAQKQVAYLRMQRSMHALDMEIRYSLREKQRRIEELTKENHYQAHLLAQNEQIKQQNEQLKMVNEELRQFAYITSHDLKEPLRMIGSFTQMIQKQYQEKLDDNSGTYFRFINEGVNRMSSLLDALLQYATIGKTAIEPELIDIGDVVRNARTNLKIKIEETDANILCGKMPSLMSVNSLLVQLFQNLIGNAIKFRRLDSRPIILINAEEKPDHWLFSIEDNGIGVDKESHERIFVIFQRLHKRNEYEGTGIGLAICHKIVSQLGGRIWVNSELGHGSTFFFTLPK